MGGVPDTIVSTKPSFTVEARSPGAGREGVAVTAQVSVTFSTDIDPASVDVGVIAVNGRPFGDLQVSGATLLFSPSGGLTPGTTYSIALSPDIRGKNGIPLGPFAEWGFKTAGTPPVQDTVLQVRSRP